MEILRNTIPLLLAGIAFLAWKKYQDKDYLWLAGIFTINFIVKALNSFIKAFFQLTPEINIIIGGFSIVILAALVVLILKIAFGGHNAPKIHKLSDNALIQEYIEAARLWEQRLNETKHSVIIDRGDRSFDKTWAIYFEIKRRDPKLKILLPILHGREDRSRLLAARHLYTVVPQECEKVLGEISKKGGELGRIANALLVAKEKGELK